MRNAHDNADLIEALNGDDWLPTAAVEYRGLRSRKWRALIDPPKPKTAGALRADASRARRAQGLQIIDVPVSEANVDMLASLGLLAPLGEHGKAEIAAAIKTMLDHTTVQEPRD